MNSIIYPVIKSSMPPKEEYMEEISSLWDTRWLTNHGAKAEELERQAAAYLDAEQIICAVNGHQALELAIQAMGLKGEVITTPFTFVSTTAAIVRCGLTPVFCDIREDDYTLDPEKIEALITEKTCAILPVHVYGNICQVERIAEIARKHNLKVIYDAAHAFGARYKGQGAGAFGDASMFSLHATKVFNSVEGGLVTFHDPEISPLMWQYQNFGITGPETVEQIAGNAKMNEFAAAMGLCNMRHVDSYIAARKAAYDRYIARLGNLKGIRLNRIPEQVQSNYAYFPIVVDPSLAGIDRNQLADVLAENGIGTRKYFAPAVSDFEAYRQYDRGNTPVAAAISAQVLTLPMYSDLTPEDVDRICDVIVSAISRN